MVVMVMLSRLQRGRQSRGDLLRREVDWMQGGDDCRWVRLGKSHKGEGFLAYREELEREEDQRRDKRERQRGELKSKDFFKHSFFSQQVHNHAYV